MYAKQRTAGAAPTSSHVGGQDGQSGQERLVFGMYLIAPGLALLIAPNASLSVFN